MISSIWHNYQVGRPLLSPLVSTRRCLTVGAIMSAMAFTMDWSSPARASPHAAHDQSSAGLSEPHPVRTGAVLTLEEAVALSTGGQPGVAAFESEADASEQAAVAARQLPDPTLTTGVRDFPVTGNQAFSPTADNFTMYMIGIMREQVRRSKREAEAARLRAEAVVSRAEGTVQERRIQRDVRIAWINAVEAAAKQGLLVQVIADLEVGHRVMEAGIPTGAATPSTALQMQAEISLAEVRLAVAQGQEQRARAELARWIGAAAGRPLPNRIPTIALPAGTEKAFDPVEHPQIRLAEAQEAAARRQVDVAQRDRRPNVTWSLNYGWRPNFGDLVTAQIGIPLQLNRSRIQDRRIAEASDRANAARLRAEDARRELGGAFGSAFADYNSADAQLSILTSKAVPSLEASFDVAEARYGAGEGTLELPLSLVRRYVETTIQSLEEQAKRARAAAELTYLTQDSAR